MSLYELREPKCFITSSKHACPLLQKLSSKAIDCTNKGNQCLYSQRKPMGNCFPASGRLATEKETEGESRTW